MKTARFSQVVAKAGRPSVHLLWTAPDKDKSLQQALHAGRVMTIHWEARGSKASYGHVGLPEGTEKSQILVFPKSLKSFAQDRVVGIDYDLVEQGLGSGTDPAHGPKSAKPAKTGGTGRKAGQRASAPLRPPAEDEERREASGEAAKTSELPIAAPVSRKPKAEPEGRRSGENAGLLKVIRAAMTDLEKGNAVAAYKRLSAVAG